MCVLNTMILKAILYIMCVVAIVLSSIALANVSKSDGFKSYGDTLTQPALVDFNWDSKFQNLLPLLNKTFIDW